MTPKLTYNQLREILALVVSAAPLRLKLEDLLAGRAASITELEFIELISESQADKELIRIYSGKDPNAMDAIEGLEYIADFFAYMKANKQKFASWLSSFGYQAAASVKTTPSPTSK